MRQVTDIEVANKFVNLMSSAKSRQKRFDLKLISVRNLLKAEKCYYSGRPLTKETLTIDRVDNSKGYVVGNVVACHITINQLKNQLSIRDIEMFYKKTRKHVEKV